VVLRVLRVLHGVRGVAWCCVLRRPSQRRTSLVHFFVESLAGKNLAKIVWESNCFLKYQLNGASIH
jgi:hypothetical protein